MSFGTIITAMITPFDDRGNLNLDEAGRIASWLVDRGNDGLVLAGTTGEGQTLDDAERNDLIRAVKNAVGDRACVIANTGGSDTRRAIGATKAAKEAGADAILSVVPFYSKPPQSGMLRHFGAIAESTSLPVIIYNIPGRTAVNMLPETLLELAERHHNVVAVKESSGDLKQIAITAREAKKLPPRSTSEKYFRVLSGDDHLFLPSLAVGASGLVGVTTHIASREYRALLDAFNAGNTEEATRIHHSLLPLSDTLFAAASPIPVKWAMHQLGFKTGECRSPLDKIPETIAERLDPLLAPYLMSSRA
jgi:4-hydroxy-tetrahydrodipicolinate synthase